MSALLTLSRVLLFVWLILQTFAGSIKGINCAPEPLSPPESYVLAAEGLSSGEEVLNGTISSPETLHIPDALLTPIPSFQFNLTEFLKSFLFVIFSFYVITKVQEIPAFFTRAYFQTLFSSLILINAP